tara:strand:+ start:69 stop:470 length:402 start_codon:yes stop_codon:yes gene_type:complete
MRPRARWDNGARSEKSGKTGVRKHGIDFYGTASELVPIATNNIIHTSASANSSLCGNSRQAILVERINHLLGVYHRDSTVTFCQHVDPECKEHPGTLEGKGSANTTAVGTDQIFLQLCSSEARRIFMKDERNE